MVINKANQIPDTKAVQFFFMFYGYVWLDIRRTEEVQHAHVSACRLYREVFQEGWWKIYVSTESFLCPKSIGAINPIQPIWFDFNVHNPLETLSRDK